MDKLNELTSVIEKVFTQQGGWARCRYLLANLIAKKDIEIKQLQAEFTGELTQSPLEKIRAKCAQYWNSDTTLCPEELHAILEFIHQLARSAETDLAGFEAGAQAEAYAGDEARAEVTQLQTKIEQLKQKHSNVLNFIDGVRDIARNRNPNGVTILDFMTVWNEQYEDRIKQLQIDLVSAQAEAKAGDEAQTEVTQLQNDLNNLLAIIHRDGGHHTQEVGEKQSVIDAIQVWAVRQVEIDQLKGN